MTSSGARSSRSGSFDAAFARALDIAGRPKERGPSNQWLDAVRQLRAAPSSTFLPMFATAALARATDETLDPLTLKKSATAGAGLRAYSARGVATNHLMRLARLHDLDLGTSGNEPLNNAPFFGADRVDEIEERVHSNARAYFQDLLDALTSLQRSNSEQATYALAAVIHLTRRTARPVTKPVVVHDEVDASEALRRLAAFVDRRSERGARGQAVVAGLLRTIHGGATTGRVHEPSRRLPGDVHVRTDPNAGTVSLAVEVRQKRVTEAGVLAFAMKCGGKGLQNAMVVALSADQADLDVASLTQRCMSDHGVAVVIVTSLHELFAHVASFSNQPHHAIVERAAATITDALVEVGVSTEARAEFARLWL